MNSLGILIPLAPFLLGGFAIWMRYLSKTQEARLRATAASTAESAAQYASHITQLEERVRVLERIVTDKGYDVATQIEALRDSRRVEEPKLAEPNRPLPVE
ncbi:MAG: hypothetical protein ACTHLU_07935 [Novosphingobium sp.]